MVQVRGELVHKDPYVSVYFDINYRGIARYAMQSVELGQVLDRIAGGVTRYARLISPYDPNSDSQVHYRDSWQHYPYTERRVGDPPLGAMPRQAQIVMNDSAHAMAVEFGNGRTNPIYGHRIFAKLVDYIESYIP